MSLADIPWQVPGANNQGTRACGVWSYDGDRLIATCNSPHYSLAQNQEHAKAIAALPQIVEFMLLLREFDELRKGGGNEALLPMSLRQSLDALLRKLSLP